MTLDFIIEAMPERSRLLRLLAEIDQQIAEARTLASDPVLTKADRRFVAVQMQLRREALDRIVITLGKVDGK